MWKCKRITGGTEKCHSCGMSIFRANIYWPPWYDFWSKPRIAFICDWCSHSFSRRFTGNKPK